MKRQEHFDDYAAQTLLLIISKGLLVETSSLSFLFISGIRIIDTVGLIYQSDITV